MKCFAVAFLGRVCVGSQLRKPHISYRTSQNTPASSASLSAANASRDDIIVEKYSSLVLKGLRITSKLSMIALGLR